MEVGGIGPLIALSLDVFQNLPARKAVITARQTGYRAVGIPATWKDFSPAPLGESGTRDLAAFLSRNGIAAAVVMAGARGRFTLSATLEEDIHNVRQMIALAGRLKAEAALVQAGQLGAKDSAAAQNLRQALARLADAADGAGVSLAVGAAPGEERVLEGVLDEFEGAPLGMVVNPGTLIFGGADAVGFVSTTKRIAAVVASDASAEEAGLAPGEGRAPWRDLLAALAARGYYGHMTVTFAGRGDAAARAAQALEFLRKSSVWQGAR